MRIAVFGATGGTGRALVEQGLSNGHNVTAFVRNPQKLSIMHERLSFVKGDVLNPEDVERAVRDQDAVLSVLGPTKHSPANICSAGTKNIMHAMKKHGVRRLIVQSAFGAGDTRKKGLYARLLSMVIPSFMNDKDVMEKAVKESGVEWIIVRPAALTNGPKRGTYRVPDTMPFIPMISRADVADFILHQLESDEYLHATPAVAY
jgi:putative NADH-flavin reductase